MSFDKKVVIVCVATMLYFVIGRIVQLNSGYQDAVIGMVSIICGLLTYLIFFKQNK